MRVRWGRVSLVLLFALVVVYFFNGLTGFQVYDSGASSDDGLTALDFFTTPEDPPCQSGWEEVSGFGVTKCCPTDKPELLLDKDVLVCSPTLSSSSCGLSDCVCNNYFQIPLPKSVCKSFVNNYSYLHGSDLFYQGFGYSPIIFDYEYGVVNDPFYIDFESFSLNITPALFQGRVVSSSFSNPSDPVFLNKLFFEDGDFVDMSVPSSDPVKKYSNSDKCSDVSCDPGYVDNGCFSTNYQSESGQTSYELVCCPDSKPNYDSSSDKCYASVQPLHVELSCPSWSYLSLSDITDYPNSCLVSAAVCPNGGSIDLSTSQCVFDVCPNGFLHGDVCYDGEGSDPDTVSGTPDVGCSNDDDVPCPTGEVSVYCTAISEADQILRVCCPQSKPGFYNAECYYISDPSCSGTLDGDTCRESVSYDDSVFGGWVDDVNDVVKVGDGKYCPVDGSGFSWVYYSDGYCRRPISVTVSSTSSSNSIPVNSWFVFQKPANTNSITIKGLSVGGNSDGVLVVSYSSRNSDDTGSGGGFVYPRGVIEISFLTPNSEYVMIGSLNGGGVSFDTVVVGTPQLSVFLNNHQLNLNKQGGVWTYSTTDSSLVNNGTNTISFSSDTLANFRLEYLVNSSKFYDSCFLSDVRVVDNQVQFQIGGGVPNTGDYCKSNKFLEWKYNYDVNLDYDVGLFLVSNKTVPIKVFNNEEGLSYGPEPYCGDGVLLDSRGESCRTCPGDLLVQETGSNPLIIGDNEYELVGKSVKCSVDNNCINFLNDLRSKYFVEPDLNAVCDTASGLCQFYKGNDENNKLPICTLREDGVSVKCEVVGDAVCDYYLSNNKDLENKLLSSLGGEYNLVTNLTYKNNFLDYGGGDQTDWLTPVRGCYVGVQTDETEPNWCGAKYYYNRDWIKVVDNVESSGVLTLEVIYFIKDFLDGTHFNDYVEEGYIPFKALSLKKKSSCIGKYDKGFCCPSGSEILSRSGKVFCCPQNNPLLSENNAQFNLANGSAYETPICCPSDKPLWNPKLRVCEAKAPNGFNYQGMIYYECLLNTYTDYYEPDTMLFDSIVNYFGDFRHDNIIPYGPYRFVAALFRCRKFFAINNKTPLAVDASRFFTTIINNSDFMNTIHMIDSSHIPYWGTPALMQVLGRIAVEGGVTDIISDSGGLNVGYAGIFVNDPYAWNPLTYSHMKLLKDDVGEETFDNYVGVNSDKYCGGSWNDGYIIVEAKEKGKKKGFVCGTCNWPSGEANDYLLSGMNCVICDLEKCGSGEKCAGTFNLENCERRTHGKR